METKEQLEQKRYELRLINKAIQREEAIEELKKKHFVGGTFEEQKATVLEKSSEVEVEIARINEEEKNAKDILDQQATKESEA